MNIDGVGPTYCTYCTYCAHRSVTVPAGHDAFARAGQRAPGIAGTIIAKPDSNHGALAPAWRNSVVPLSRAVLRPARLRRCSA